MGRPVTDRTGETKIAKNNLKMTIIQYNTYKDIIVEFEDGEIVNTDMGSFNTGYVKHPKVNTKQVNGAKLHVGEISIAKNNMIMKIIAYRKRKDIDVEFEDGTIAYNKSYNSFLTGDIAHPSKNNRLGETNISRCCKLKMTIIKYNAENNIDIQFEDGAIVYNRAYSNFKNGSIAHPILNNPKLKHIGETAVNRKNQLMTIIDYIDINHVKVQFEDGATKIATYSNFTTKNILHPTENRYTPHNHIGETKINKQGIAMTIINGLGRKNLTIKFNTGYTKNIKEYASFYRNSIKHPFPYQMDNILIEKKAYLHNGIGNFYCKCDKCGKQDIWTIEEAKNHKCEEITND